MTETTFKGRVALIEAGSPGLHIYSHVAMGRGVALLATVVRDAGYEVRGFVEDISGRGSVDWDYVRDADVIGFSSITCTIPRTSELLAQARDVNPRAVVVFGGPEPTCDPHRSFRVGADYVVRGEAEYSLPAFLDAVVEGRGGDLRRIPGIVWQEEGRVIEGPPARQLTREELDAVPLVDRSLVHLCERGSVASVWRARGCPQRCDFCEVCEIWPRYVRRNDERSVAEMVQAQASGFGTAFLIDDNAAADKPSFKEFLRKVAKGGFSGALVTQIRADAAFKKDGRLDRELLRLLKKAASLTIVCIGVESADDEDLERLHKKIDSSHMAKALKAMRRRGLLVHGMFIALAEDSREIIRRNGEYARKYVTSLQYLFETPLPGTKRTRRHEERGGLLFDKVEDLAYYDGMHVSVRPERMSPAEMQELVAGQYRRFYSIPRIVAAALRGTFLRYRRLTEAQRDFLRRLDPRQRIRAWFRFHVEYKFAPVAFLAIGRRRVQEFMGDSAYSRYNDRLQSL